MNRQLLEESLAIVDLPDDGLTLRFYEILFARYPAVQPMFRRDITTQADMLRTAIISVLDHLDNAEWLSSNLGWLGRRHAGMGVTPPMYDAVGECMIAAMAEIGGDAWTSEMSDAWTDALTAVSSMMVDGYPSE
ncbi:globin domain-containing protein [Gordonia sp. ABSL11-1]|uniref:globin domain-containing protein n=1 Tax=Gordonia sp. ABSL11-1 TaxID=3053924 RepID=UPI002574478A|nr:globin domain-containing protein [Gordonia sp. ABSL11-1]MDL9948329.1 globin domain-containing protein [Gordonia sp. ABSL11-1]